ncbi:MAG: hypothetical protein H7844_13055 [Nitrospirae bacterium YQR-1]
MTRIPMTRTIDQREVAMKFPNFSKEGEAHKSITMIPTESKKIVCLTDNFSLSMGTS